MNTIPGSTIRRNILLDADKYWWIASLSDVWKGMGWGTILYLASMAGIDPTYYPLRTHRRNLPARYPCGTHRS